MSQLAPVTVATIRCRRNRPTRTLELGRHPEGHPKAGRPWRRFVRAGQSFNVTQDELDRIEVQRATSPVLARDLVVKPTVAAKRRPEASLGGLAASSPTPKAPKGPKASTRSSTSS